MRQRPDRPSDTEFVAADDYERSAPAGFNLPETAVLYLSVDIGNHHAWVASDGFYLSKETHSLYDFDEISVLEAELRLPDQTLPLTPALSRQISESIARCESVFAQLKGDHLEIAEPEDYETGNADDLGNPELVNNYGEGETSALGSSTAVKRRRSSV